MAEKHELQDAEVARGQRGSALIRTAQKNEFLWEVRRHLIELAKSGELGTTLRERADQLNARGVRTSQRNLLDEKKLGAALKALGVDSSTLNGLIHSATKAADDLGADDAEMFEQLWHEWLYHHTRVMVETGSIFGLSDKQKFVFKGISPHIWRTKQQPKIRDPRVMIWWYGERRVLPPQARLVYALIGMFGYEKRSRANGAMIFP